MTISPEAVALYAARGEPPIDVPGGHVDVMHETRGPFPAVTFERAALIESTRRYVVEVARELRGRDFARAAAIGIGRRLLASPFARAIVAPPPVAMPPDDGNLGALRSIAMREAEALDGWLAGLPWSTTIRQFGYDVDYPRVFAPAIFTPVFHIGGASQAPVIVDAMADAVLQACGWTEDGAWVVVMRPGMQPRGLSPSRIIRETKPNATRDARRRRFLRLDV